MKAIEVGFDALGHLGYPIPVDPDKAANWSKDLRTRVPTEPDIIAVRFLTGELSLQSWRSLPVTDDQRIVCAHEVYATLVHFPLQKSINMRLHQ